MASFNKFYPFVAAAANGTFNLGSDTLEIALTDSAPVDTYSNKSSLTEISYSNLSSRTFTASSSSQTGGTYSLKAAALTLTASGTVAQFRYVVLYDSTASGALIGWWDYGSEVNLLSGDTFEVGFDQTNGILQLT